MTKRFDEPEIKVIAFRMEDVIITSEKPDENEGPMNSDF